MDFGNLIAKFANGIREVGVWEQLGTQRWKFKDQRQQRGWTFPEYFLKLAVRGTAGTSLNKTSLDWLEIWKPYWSWYWNYCWLQWTCSLLETSVHYLPGQVYQHLVVLEGGKCVGIENFWSWNEKNGGALRRSNQTQELWTNGLNIFET